MKNNNVKLLKQLSKLTQDLEFPWSDSDYPIYSFLWEIEALGEFTIENLFRKVTPQFEPYEEGGHILKTANLEDYLQKVWQRTPKHQKAIELIKKNTSFLEVVEIRSLDNPSDTFKILLGQTKSGEWMGISPQIPADFEEYSPQGEMIIGEPLLPIYLPQTSENFELFNHLETLLADLDFCEINLLGGFSDIGFIIRFGETRELMFNNLLDAIGFARTFPLQPLTPDTDSEDDFDEEYLEATQGIDNLVQSQLTNSRTYLFGIGCCYTIYFVGETSDGDVAGVVSMAVWS
ncbi:MAG: nuclease A inhibitor family protein [Cuspidothrix sp.]